MKRCYFSIATEKPPYINFMPIFDLLKNSFKKFHPNDDFILFSDDDIKQTNDNMIFYRAAPYFARKLFDAGYTEVCKLDADTIVLGNLDHIWEGDYDMAVVNNANPKEFKTYPVSVWDIDPLAYVNAGFVVMKSERFINHWLSLCYSPHFNNYQMKEQDLLNILVFYGDYKVKLLDASNKWHGLISKQYTPNAILIDTVYPPPRKVEAKIRGDLSITEGVKIVLPKNDEWPKDEDKQIVAYQFAGGHNAPDKGKYQLYFNEEVTKYIDRLVK